MALGGIFMAAGAASVFGGMARRGVRGATAGAIGGGATAVGVGMGMTGLVMGGMAVKKGMSMLERGTAFTNPMFNNATGQAYGKRGIDANNLNTNGLVQSLHSNRRRT